MALYKRGDVWWIDVLQPDGKRVRQSTKTSSKKQAQEYHDKLKNDLWMQHRLGVKADRLFSEAVALFLKEKDDLRSLKSYKEQLAWWSKKFDGKTLKAVTQEAIIEAIEEKRDAGTEPATCNRYLAALRATLRLVCLKYQWIDKVPKVFMYREPPGRTTYLTREEIARLLAVLPTHVRSMARFALATGLRKRNVVRLRWDQVDLERKTVSISGDYMKAKRDLTIPISDEAVAVIREQIGQHPEYVFTYRHKPVGRIDAGAWQEWCAAAGIEDFRWHDLRHTWATMMVQSGVPVDVIQQLGAWETASMVQRYAHHNADSLRRYADVADKIVGEAARAAPALRVVGGKSA